MLGLDPRTNRATPALKQSVRAGAFLCLVGGYMVYNGVREGFNMDGVAGRALEEVDCPDPPSAGGMVVFYIL